MLEPLLRAAVLHDGLNHHQAEWLASRSGEEERQHGDNGFILLRRSVDPTDAQLVEHCRFFVEILSDMISGTLPDTGLS